MPYIQDILILIVQQKKNHAKSIQAVQGHCIKIDVGIIENSNINLVIKNQKDSFTQVLGLEMTECKSRYR